MKELMIIIICICLTTIFLDVVKEFADIQKQKLKHKSKIEKKRMNLIYGNQAFESEEENE